MIQLQVMGLTADPGSGQHILWLWHAADHVLLPIVIGAAEAASIHPALTGEPPPRPLPHDLIKDVLEQCRARVVHVDIVELKDSTFYAQLVVGLVDRQLQLDARPSDAVALALRYKAPVNVDPAVLQQAGYAVRRDSAEGPPSATPLQGGGLTPISSRTLQTAIDQLLRDAKTAAPVQTGAALHERLSKLEEQLQQVIKLERYEDAERIQREITRLRDELGK